jgi:hypothetical protein
MIFLMKVSPKTGGNRFCSNLHHVNDIPPVSGLSFIR